MQWQFVEGAEPELVRVLGKIGTKDLGDRAAGQLQAGLVVMQWLGRWGARIRARADARAGDP